MLARLDHAHIVPVYDVGQIADGLCYVVSKYIDGSDLSHRMRQARLTFRDAAQLVGTIAGALHHAHAHTRSLVHRDIKPANILHDCSGTTRLCDELEAPTVDPGRRFRAACALATYSPAVSNARWDAVSGFVADRSLVAVLQNPRGFAALVETLRAVRGWLNGPLAAAYGAASKPESLRSLATSVLADYAGATKHYRTVTVRFVDAAMLPIRAVMTEVPFATALARPEAVMVAMPGFDDVHISGPTRCFTV
jgi:hypothetical protein